ncbi:MAG TPA: nuclear transport factor 2 family protein [Gallionellaceae bacterium]|nr:nuclear transport factor 2 family protein [Gallionellaceae bacterium]
MTRFIRAVAAISLFSLSALASAGPADDAAMHFKAIAAGNVEQIMQGYADNASLQWVGGPLDGAYAGNDKIREVWGKFAKANAPLEVAASKVEESANPKGATVTANVEFKGKASIKVRYVLVYREGKLVSEVWQIDPKLAAAY